MVQTAQELRFELLRCIEVGALKHRKCNVEMKITPWILANIAKFPELLSEPFVFVHIMPVNIANDKGSSVNANYTAVPYYRVGSDL
jgi:hypothetical protein